MNIIFTDRRGKEHASPEGAVATKRQGAWIALIENGTILFTYPNYAPDIADLPGGGINSGETALEAACREFYEETDSKVPQNLKTEQTYQQDINFYAEDVDEFWYYTQTFFLVSAPDIKIHFSGKRKVREGHCQWLKIEDVNSHPINFAHKKALQNLLS